MEIQHQHIRLEQYHPQKIYLFYVVLAVGALISALGLGSAYYMEHHGHVVTGMNNQVFWGLPHVFAIFLIVAASGVLNVASIGSVFGKKMYKPRAPLSGMLAIAMLAAGLAVIMLDLGRADRLIIAMTHFNPTSVFGWNVVLYPGFFGIVGLYLWTLMDKPMNQYSKYAGFAAFFWRIALTTGTGSIFAFVVARQAYHSAILPPMFIVMSFAWGLAAFMIVQRVMFGWCDIMIDVSIRARLKNLLGIFIAASAYFVIVYHLTNIYFAKQTGFESFILLNGGTITVIFWLGYVFLGTILPLFMLFHPDIWPRPLAVCAASGLAIVGAFSFLYVFIIGGQLYPLDIFPGMEVTSTFMDGKIDTYVPSLPEILLGFGGLGIAFTITVLGVRSLRFLPNDDVTVLDGGGHILE